jgi:hypothetical protein
MIFFIPRSVRYIDERMRYCCKIYRHFLEIESKSALRRYYILRFVSRHDSSSLFGIETGVNSFYLRPYFGANL